MDWICISLLLKNIFFGVGRISLRGLELVSELFFELNVSSLCYPFTLAHFPLPSLGNHGSHRPRVPVSCLGVTLGNLGDAYAHVQLRTYRPRGHSCQESPQFATLSCCDAVVYVMDLSPVFELGSGLCCLCGFTII